VKQDCIGLNEMKEGVCEDGREILVDISLPSDLNEGIALNIANVRHLCDLAGIGDLRVVDYEVLEDESVKGDSSVTVFAAQENDIALAKIDKWRNLDVVLDMQEIARAVEDLRDPKLWCYAVDDLLTGLLMRQGLFHLLKPSPYNSAIAMSFAAIYGANWKLAVFLVLNSLALTSINMGEPNSYLSLFNFFGIELDRAVLLYRACKRVEIFEVLEDEE